MTKPVVTAFYQVLKFKILWKMNLIILHMSV